MDLEQPQQRIVHILKQRHRRIKCKQSAKTSHIGTLAGCGRVVRVADGDAEAVVQHDQQTYFQKHRRISSCGPGPFSYVLSADNLFMTAGRTSLVRWSRNCAIVPNLFLQQGQPGAVTPLPPWATDGGSSTNVSNSWRLISCCKARSNTDFCTVELLGGVQESDSTPGKALGCESSRLLTVAGQNKSLFH